MALASQTQHKTISNTALPYISNSSVIPQTPQYIPGSLNAMTSIIGYAERRPGFAQQVESSATLFNNCQRIFYWRRWANSSPNGGAYVAMACDLDGVSKVYKMVQGVDTTFQLLLTSASTEPFDFVVANNRVYFGNGTDMKQYDTSSLVSWGITAPASAPTFTTGSGTLDAFTSYYYVYTYYDSTTNHESSPSPLSAPTNVLSGKKVTVSVTASTNSRVTNIRIYRTTDGGATDPTLMQEISGSPFPNTSTTHDDQTVDSSLSIRVAPQFFLNDPPPPSLGFCAYAGRIWGFINNTTYYSGNEEIANGVPQECFPSGLAGNFYKWDNEVTAHAPLIDGVAVFNAEVIYKIEGDSLDTFRRYTLLQRRGTRSRTSVTSLGGSVVWLDTSNTVWISDLGEIGVDIRPDLKTLDPTRTWIAVHISGLFHWVVVMDGANGKLYVYDLDRGKWMPPWVIGVSASAMTSAETSVGSVNLMLARNNQKVLKMTPAIYSDDGDAYSVPLVTALFSVAPAGSVAWKGVVDWVELKTARIDADNVGLLTDDDPSLIPFVDITANAEDSPDIVQGNLLITKRYPSAGQSLPQCQMAALKMTWGLSKLGFKLYQFDIATHPVGA